MFCRKFEIDYSTLLYKYILLCKVKFVSFCMYKDKWTKRKQRREICKEHFSLSLSKKFVYSSSRIQYTIRMEINTYRLNFIANFFLVSFLNDKFERRFQIFSVAEALLERLFSICFFYQGASRTLFLNFSSVKGAFFD